MRNSIVLSREDKLDLTVNALVLLGLPERPRRILMEHGINTVKKILPHHPYDFMRMEGMGRVSVNWIARVLRKLDLGLGIPIEWKEWVGGLGSRDEL